LINDTLTQIIEIKDVTKPSAVCTDQINLSISQDFAVLHYTDIDGGSSDACGIELIEVSRDEVNWDSIVTFDCTDIHQETVVHLRVTDKKGNQATCWMQVEVEDKIAPVCNDLADRTVDCDKYHTAELGTVTDINDNKEFEEVEWLDMTAAQMTFYNMEFGNPDCFDNVTCDELVIEQQYQLIEKACGVFQAMRRYRARDWAGQGKASNWAVQNINAEVKPNWTITLPADWQGTCGDELPDSEVLITNAACDLLGYEVEEKTFTTIEDACLKVVRTFTIINWCKYQAGDETVSIARNEDEHGIANSPVVLTSEGNEAVGRLEYIQILKVSDVTAPIITLQETDNCITGENCNEIKTFAITATDCNEAATQNLVAFWTLSTGEQQIATGEGQFFEAIVEPKIPYVVKWTVQDNCGNVAWKEQDYEFWDCKKPAPYCLNGVVVDLMETGNIQVWATDIEQNSSDNCTAAAQLDFRIWHASLGTAPTTDEGVMTLPKVITLDCQYLGTQAVNLYVIDEEGNWDYCRTTVTVQDNNKACQNTAAMALVSGTIMDWKAQTVEEVLVSATNTATAYMTKEDGHYGFDLATGKDYTIIHIS